MLNVGIIGLGNIGIDAHLKAYNKIKEENGPVRVVAVCDEVEARLAEVREHGQGFREYRSIDEMLKAEAGKLDYVDICLPTHLHAEVAIKAMEMGYNVLCEKPMAISVEAAEAMVEAKNRTGKKLMIAYCNRFWSGARFVKDVVDSGELGKPLYAEFRHTSNVILLNSLPSSSVNVTDSISLNAPPERSLNSKGTSYAVAFPLFVTAIVYVTDVPRKNVPGYSTFRSSRISFASSTVRISANVLSSVVKWNMPVYLPMVLSVKSKVTFTVASLS